MVSQLLKKKQMQLWYNIDYKAKHFITLPELQVILVHWDILFCQTCFFDGASESWLSWN